MPTHRYFIIIFFNWQIKIKFNDLIPVNTFQINMDLNNYNFMKYFALLIIGINVYSDDRNARLKLKCAIRWPIMFNKEKHDFLWLTTEYALAKWSETKGH